MKTNINLSTLAGGAVGERINIELQKVAENVQDPNTDWKKARKVVVTITLKPDEEREIALVSADVKTTLAPAHGIATKIIFGVEKDGSTVAAELVSGMKNQMMIDNDGDLADELGQKVAGSESESNVSYLQRKSQEAK
ncbi:replication terminator protein [Paenibacillus sp. FSL R10-2771]|uniref:replication terminator protein n=1 Tax=Paenibacillus sp. FSL R10-2771 TaxID=2954693 RepID=UPI0030FA1CA8